MKVVAGYVAHYGLQYAKQSIESIYPYVDKIVMLYSWLPSFGWWDTNLKCPDTKDDFLKLVQQYPKIEFTDITGKIAGEGALRDWIQKYECNGYDILIPLDLDEIMPPNLPEYLEEVAKSHFKHLGVEGYIHFWKNLDWYCTDHFTPYRFINLNKGEGHGTIKMPVYHCSYNQSKEIINYKMATFTHAPEIKKNWFKEKWLNWNPETKWLHPVSDAVWEQAKKRDFELPKILCDTKG